MAKIQKHDAYDWCHACGTRSDGLADLWFPSRSAPPHVPNAEAATAEQHARGWGEPDTEYLRICATCAETLRAVATGERAGPVVVRQRKRRRAA